MTWITLSDCDPVARSTSNVSHITIPSTSPASQAAHSDSRWLMKSGPCSPSRNGSCIPLRGCFFQ